MVQSACAGGVTVSADQCDVTLDTYCPFPGDVARYDVDRGSIHWSDTGSIGVGIIDDTHLDGAGNVICHSTYDVTYMRQ